MTDNDSPLAALEAEWDEVTTRAQEAAAAFDDRETAYERLDAKNAVLLREGKPLKDADLLGAAKRTLKAAEIALPEIVQEATEIIRAERDDDLLVDVPLPDRAISGAELVAHVRHQFDIRARAVEAGRHRKERIAEYRRVVDKVNDAKAEHLRRGHEEHPGLDDGTIQAGFSIASVLTEDELEVWKEGNPRGGVL